MSRSISYPAPVDACDVSPISCDFKVGDQVTVTNGYGIKIPGKRITGFTKDIDPAFNPARFIYLDWDCYWFPVRLEDIELEVATA